MSPCVGFVFQLIEFKNDLFFSLSRMISQDDVVTDKKIYPKKAKPISPHEKLRRVVTRHCEHNNLTFDESELPKKWKICEDLLILPANCFTAEHWSPLSHVWSAIAECFGVKRVAQERRVNTDELRTPNLTLLYGTDPVVTIINNQIKYLKKVKHSLKVN